MNIVRGRRRFLCVMWASVEMATFKVLPAFRWLQPVDAVRGYNTAMNLVLWRVVGAVRGFNR